MKRRGLIGLLGASVAVPARLQARAALPIVGYLGSESPQVFASRLAAFRAALPAKALDLTVPIHLHSRADEVVE